MSDDGISRFEFELMLAIVGGWQQHEDGSWSKDWMWGDAKVRDSWDGKIPVVINRSVMPAACVNEITINVGLADEK